jgi:hypothetical protein
MRGRSGLATAIALLTLGCIMNVVGVILGSSRDLVVLGSAIAEYARSLATSAWQLARRLWMRVLGRKQDAQVLGISGSAHAVSSGKATLFTWNDIPDDLSVDEVVLRLRSRTDSLRDMLEHERSVRSDVVDRVDARVRDVEAELDTGLKALDARIDDIDVKPAGQRAIGAVLIICGSALMFIGGLLGL